MLLIENAFVSRRFGLKKEPWSSLIFESWWMIFFSYIYIPSLFILHTPSSPPPFPFLAPLQQTKHAGWAVPERIKTSFCFYLWIGKSMLILYVLRT